METSMELPTAHLDVPAAAHNAEWFIELAHQETTSSYLLSQGQKEAVPRQGSSKARMDTSTERQLWVATMGATSMAARFTRHPLAVAVQLFISSHSKTESSQPAI